MSTNRGAVRLLLVAAGAIFVVGAIVHNTWILGIAARAAGSILHRPVHPPHAPLVHHAQLVYLALGAAFFVLAWLVGRWGPLDRFVRKPLVEKLALAVLVVVVPSIWLEVGLRPFLPAHEKTTTLFVKDDRLGWKLRPGALDRWGDVEVSVNERGFRGPVIPYPKPSGVARVVYLGDSVTFGYRVARWEDTYPFLLDALLDDSLSVETVNLAVEGYSQWQQAILLADEGDRYQPDLVVIGFVLNDVTEMFYLARFGGSDEGFQLRHSYTSQWDRLLSKSALVYQVQNLVREMKAKRKLGDDLRLGAIRQQALDVETLMQHPDQANVKTAWDIALADLQGIVDHCSARGVPVLVVVFPFTVQLSDPEGLSAPQRVVENYARARGIETMDLLPPLVEHMRASGASADSLFLDHDHLSVEGHRVVAGILAPRVAALLAAQTTG
ncbi:MAG TPA: SGNH/GDSL hydrolase family protein, partial [Candidatus Krumholzibacteria bacterium]|nr:SGNH/GDSL hydrolase family protein [Candidatus Krumholzibacteria bacterium]